MKDGRLLETIFRRKNDWKGRPETKPSQRVRTTNLSCSENSPCRTNFKVRLEMAKEMLSRRRTSQDAIQTSSKRRAS